MTLRVIEEHETEYAKLKLVADMLTIYSPNKAKYIVGVTYFDFGQDWKWTTIIRKNFHECQILSPREWELIVASETIDDLFNVVYEITNDKYNMDYTEREVE